MFYCYYSQRAIRITKAAEQQTIMCDCVSKSRFSFLFRLSIAERLCVRFMHRIRHLKLLCNRSRFSDVTAELCLIVRALLPSIVVTFCFVLNPVEEEMVYSVPLGCV